MPNDDPRDGFFYPNLTLMINSYNLAISLIGMQITSKAGKGVDTDQMNSLEADWSGSTVFIK